MSSPPEPRTFEGWIEEDWPGGTTRPDVMAVLEPYRGAVQYALDDFDDETQSWRDQCGRIYGWGFGPNDEGAVPHAVQKKVSEMMSREPEPEPVKASAGATVDLDAWRAEAGACAPLDAAATRGPWRSTWGDDEGADAERGKRGEEVTIEAVGLEGLARIVLGVTWYDGPHPCCREEDAAFIAAARTGWPRDAARVGVLCERVRALEAILDLLPHCLGTWVKGSGGHCVYANDCQRIATVYEDGADGYDFCDVHGARNIRDEHREEYLWARPVRDYEAMRAAGSAPPKGESR